MKRRPLGSALFLLALLLALATATTGCPPKPTPATHAINITAAGPDRMSVYLDRTKSDRVQWTNSTSDSIEIVFERAGLSLLLAPGEQSRVVLVSEFAARGNYPYRVKRLGFAGRQAASADTVGGPGGPDIDVGP